MVQWRKSLWWWGVRPAGFVPGWGDTSVAATPEFADRPMRAECAPEAGSQSVRDAARAQAALVAFKAALKAFLQDQVSDLELVRAQRAVRPLGASREVRYRHPVHGHTWDGQGRQPQWLRDALLHEGWLLIDLRHAAQAVDIECSAAAAAH